MNVLKFVRLYAVKTALSIASRLSSRPALQWLAHYAKGSGTTKVVPSHLVTQVEDTFHLVLERGLHEGNSLWVHHSTLYEGAGFRNRPELFYLVGGFTAKYLPSKKMVVFRDKYDWHPAKAGEYFTSGMGFPEKINKVLNFFLGEEYYPLHGFPMGNPGFSNKLWHELELIGAKPFLSVGKVEMELRIPDPYISSELIERKRYKKYKRLSHIKDGLQTRFDRVWNNLGYKTRDQFITEKEGRDIYTVSVEGDFSQVGELENLAEQLGITLEIVSE